jgi:hypothetical protein
VSPKKEKIKTNKDFYYLWKPFYIFLKKGTYTKNYEGYLNDKDPDLKLIYFEGNRVGDETQSQEATT